MKTLNQKKKELFELLVQYYELKPEESWCTYERHRGNSHCALGWLDEDFTKRGLDPKRREYIVTGTVLELTQTGGYGYGIVRSNNNELRGYNQPTPKQRVLAYLNDEINKL